MPELIIPDVDVQLIDRIRRFSAARGWPQSKTLILLLESGLHHGEGHVPGNFADPEQSALADAITALKSLP